MAKTLNTKECNNDIQARYACCIAACPVNTDNRQLVEFIIKGDYEAALELLLEANPFSSVCGRICHHPCEQNCRRNKVDEPVSLKNLKRFVIENTRKHRGKIKKNITPDKNKKIAIIGSGPAGLTAAHDLAIAGFPVVVFERDPTPGGMLGTAIPRYRLPYKVIEEDIQYILSLGVELRTGVEVGKDVILENLKKDFAAVLIASGLSESRTLGIPGIDSNGVILALPFLRAVRLGKPPAIGNHVVVIGGGNVAIDAARSARRLGISDVTLVCLESRDQMPSWEWEINEALEEGTRLLNSWGPKSIFTTDGVVHGMELHKCLSVFDKNGRFNPQFDETDTSTLPADTIIISIGQRSDLVCLEQSTVRVERERLEYDPETMTTSDERVFSCGEVVTGPGAAVEAVAEGHRAAKAIAHYLETGELLRQKVSELPPVGDLPEETIEKIKKLTRIPIELSSPEERIRGFSEIERGYTEVEARTEARRCLACTSGAIADDERCSACLTCVRICPFSVATVEKTAVMPEEKCQACGLCAAECPAAAIALKRFGTNQMKEELNQLIAQTLGEKRPTPFIVSFCCLFAITSRQYIQQVTESASNTGIMPVMVPCVARLSIPDILAPFELGADGIVIISCSEDKCLYPSADQRLANRVEKTKSFLAEIGLEPERLDVWKTEKSAEESWGAFWESSRQKIVKCLNAGGKL